MLGPILIRQQFDSEPALGQDFTCQDFHCPQRWSCKHQWLRRYEYWAFICWTEGKRKYKAPPIWTPYRAWFEHQCKHYELDKPREWMRGVCDAPGRPCPGCEMPECRNAAKVVPIGARKA